MKKQYIKFLLTAAILTSGDNLFSGEQLYFQKHFLQLEGKVYQVIVKDVNGDLSPDILVLHTRSTFSGTHVDRLISIFFQKNNCFSNESDQILTADQNEIAFDIEDIDSDGLPELLFLKTDGIYQRKYSGNGFSRRLELILKIPSIFLSNDPSKLFQYNFVRDVDGNGVPDFIIPQPHRFVVISKNRRGEWENQKKLWMFPEYSILKKEGLTFSFKLPSIYLADFNGDNIVDLFSVTGDVLNVYLQHHTELYFFLIPPDLHYRMGAESIGTSALSPIAPELTSLELKDLNRDGYVDVLLTKASRASFTKNITQIQIYLNRAGRLNHLPDQILTAENFTGEHVISDFNQDGLLDIALLTFKIGFAQAIKFFITRKVSNSYDFYLMHDENTYPGKPAGKISFSRRVKIGSLFNSNICRSFNGDFNGDGIKDFLIGTDANEFSIFMGRHGSLPARNSVFKINGPISTHLWVGNINKDKYSDIILWYPENSKVSDKVLLMVNICRTE